MTESGDPFTALSARELACIRGVAEHKRSPQIAHELGLAQKTVDTYISNALRKLGFNDRDSAARAYLMRQNGTGGKSPSAFSGVEDEGADRVISVAARLPWPFPTERRATNDLDAKGTIAAILIAATFLMAVAALYLLAIRMISERF